MEVKNYFATDSQGNVLGSAQVYLYLAGTTTLATGLQNISGAALANPFTSQSNGLVQFKAPDADYDLRVVKPGREFTIRIQCFDGIAFVREFPSGVTYDGKPLSETLDNGKTFDSYDALRSYTGSAKVVQVVAPGIKGVFDLAEGLVDDGGYIVGRYRRRLDPFGFVCVQWYQPPTSGDALSAFNKAAALAVSLQNGSSSASTPYVIVEGGTFSLSAPTTGQVNWWLTPTGKLTTPTSIPGMDFSCERLTGTIHRETGSNQYISLIVGDGAMSANKVLNDIGAPNLFPAEIMGCSDNAAGGVTGTSRTGSRNGVDQASIGVTGLSVNDNEATPKAAYAFYGEAVRLPGTGNSNAAELTIANYGSEIEDTPFRTRGADNGETYNAVLTGGGAAGSGVTNATGAILVSGKALGAYLAGIVFKVGSIVGAAKHAIRTPVDYAWAWYASLTTIDALLDSKTHLRTSRSTTLSDGVFDKQQRTGGGLTAVPAGSIVYRSESFSHNGTSYVLSAHDTLTQVTSVSSGVARHSRAFACMGSDGVMVSVSINGRQNRAFSPDTDNDWDLGEAAFRWGNARIRQVRPGAGAVIWTSGAGSPEGRDAAPRGSIYTQTDGSGLCTWYKDSGNGATGWVNR